MPHQSGNRAQGAGRADDDRGCRPRQAPELFPLTAQAPTETDVAVCDNSQRTGSCIGASNPRVRESGMRSAGRTTVILRCAIPVAGPTPTTHGSSSSWSPLFVARIVPFSDYHDKRATRVEESAERPMSDAPAVTARLRLEPAAQRAVAHGRLGSPGAASVARVGNGQEVVHLRPVAHRLVTGAESGTGPSLAVSHRAGDYEE